jgi:hypothetical protein
MEKPTYPILNKSKEGIKISIDGHHLQMTWEEFNSLYIILPEDKHRCTITDEGWEAYKKGDELVANAISASIFAESPNQELATMGKLQLADALLAIQVHFGCNMLQAMHLVARKKQQALESLRQDFSRPYRPKKTPEEIRAEKEKEDTMRRETVSTATQSMSDVKGMDKLKEKFNIK